MSNLSNILNPETSRSRPHNAPIPVTLGFPGPSTIAPQQEETPRQRSGTTNYDHAPHPDCPDTLACLPDTDGRPQHTLPVILRCAILGSPRKRLTIREIYAAMEEKYAYYRTAGATWKQSVRHHLSLNRLFERQPRPVTDPGFGSYWTVNLAAPPGTKRPRKRGRGNKDKDKDKDGNAKGSAVPASVNPVPLPQVQMYMPPQHAIPVNGPPPISPNTVLPPPPPQHPPAQIPETEIAGPSSLQRVRKQSNGRGSTPLSSHDGEDDDESARFGDGPPESGDEYESDDDYMNSAPYDRRDSFQLTPYPPPPRSAPAFSLPPITSLDKGSTSENVVERLQSEIDNLRRQSAEAVSVSLRLSEQLAQAQAEVSRSRATVRSLEDRLQDESSRRREAERQASEEAKRRRMAEEAFGVGRSPDRSRPL